MDGNTRKTMSKYTINYLKEMQKWDLDHKIQVSKARIIEFAERFNNKIYVLFSSCSIISSIKYLTL